MPITPSDAEVTRAAALLRAGALVAMPTETVYGLGVDATKASAVAGAFLLKGRPANHPLIVHLGVPLGARLFSGASPALDSAGARNASEDTRAQWLGLLEQWAIEVPEAAVELASAFWPGPLTLILRKQPWVPSVVTGGQDTIGLRVPAHPVALALLAALSELKGPGEPCGIAAPSANRFGAVSPTTAEHVLQGFEGQLVPVADLADGGALPDGVSGVVLDGGPCQVGVESTIVDLTTSAPRILRPGAITAEQLLAVLPVSSAGSTVIDVQLSAPRVPGQLASHYSPRAEVILLELGDLELAEGASTLYGAVPSTMALIGPASVLAEAHVARGLHMIELPDDLVGQARELYAALREADSRYVDWIMVLLPPAEGLGIAIRDRLERAAACGPPPTDDP